ncbi:hypothetical protein [Pseudomonas gingeri]|uniref:Uncharacterized protein n=1 Tax=Pseudomonas gingeri TaxID=117681 RepID=A0A7Y7YH35_9PSED|nr:hypothetical protein [Pseudomonas gingeri]NWB30254.1 hypothetical protein [Pseudomonas gingeri]NWC35671.1 hypothetical protein [Pseudomonas gingeri]NWD07189.1 hypothetical protein [Pseudomonas gingeri]NWE36596.1 hypothetical protein [Pseudomonas gingeri]NWE60941.1 hypothetical protein [Pseudomonas gingeri]
MNTKRSTSPDSELKIDYRLFVGSQEIYLPYAQQVKLALFRIARGDHIVISNVEYRVNNKEYTTGPTKIHAVIFANPAEPSPTVEWDSSAESSYWKAGDRYKDVSGKSFLIERVIYTRFTGTQFSVGMRLAG